MAFNTLEKSRTILRTLTFACVLSSKLLYNKFPKFKPIYLKLMLHLPATFTLTLLMWLKLASSSDFNQLSDVLYIALTETGLVVKILSVWYYDALVRSLFNEWQRNEMFKLQTTQECIVWQRTMKIYSYTAILYIACSCVASTSACVAAPFLDTYQLPVPIWLPFDWQQPKNYWYAYIYEILAVPLTCISNSTLDMFFCYMMQHLALHFKVIAMRLEDLGTKKSETNAGTKIKLLAIIELHLKLKSMSKSCETIMTYPILCQILLSALVLCFSLFRLRNFNVLEDPINFLSLALYAEVMTLQIFLFCFYGNKLILESSTLSKSLYSCNWPDMSAQNRKIVLQYMQYLQKPVVIRAGIFFNVNLMTFTKTINNAYSFFALLINMDIE